MARKLDLRDGQPVWYAYRAPAIPVDTLTRDAQADVAIVGMGISGAMIAEVLTAAGLSVIAIDRRGPMRGSTPATTALVQFEIDKPMLQLIPKIGRDDTTRAWRRSRLALSNLKTRIEHLGIRCDMVARQTLYLAGDELDADAIFEEAKLRRAAGLYAQYLSATELRDQFGIKRDAAIQSFDNLALDPRKLTAGLLNIARKRGARLCAPVEATAIVHGREGVEVTTAQGHTIVARHVVLATGYELMDGIPTDGHQIISTWAMATKPQRGKLWPGEPFIWEASDPYLYMRTTPDGRVICGGEDEEFTDEDSRNALTAQKIAAIAAKFKKLMPQLDVTADFSWTGSFGTTPTGLPLIGPVPRKPRIFSAMGYGGNGITFSRIAAELIATAIAGERDADADLFALK